MIHYRKEQLTNAQQYKFLSGSVVPRAIAWVTTQGRESGTVNLAPFSFFSLVAKELPLLSLTILREEGKQKDTAYNLSQTGEAVIHLVDETLLEQMNESAIALPRNESEVERGGLVTVNSKRVKVPGIEAAKIRYEGHVYQHIPIYNRDNTVVISDIFIMEVLDFYFSPTVFEQKNEYIDVTKLKPLARLAGPRYGVLGSTYELARPSKPI